MYCFKKNIIAIASVLLLFIFITSLRNCMHLDRKFYKTHTGKVITMMDNYIILNEYKEKKPPQNNYIKLLGEYGGGDVRMFFKENDSVLIFRNSDENSIDIVLNQNEFNIEVFYNDDIKEFKKRICFSDSSVKLEFSYYSYDKFVIISECVKDTVYIRHYGVPPFFREFVYSRYDEKLNYLYQQY